MPVITSTERGKTVTVSNDRTTAVVRDAGKTSTVTDRHGTSTVRESQRTVSVTSAGPQGSPGAPGGSFDTRLAGETLGGHRVVRSLDANRVGYASADNPAHGDDTLGLTLGAADVDTEVQVQRVGPVTFNGWNWAAGDIVFLAANGLLTQDPSDEWAFLQPIGHAESPTTLYLSIQPSILL